MKKPKIIVHLLVKNEERFIWYGINSVLPFVDMIMVWDTGSTDDTVKIVKSISSPKISFKEVGEVNADTFSTMRQKMLDETPSGYSWLMILDGDEIWPENSIKRVTNFARKNLHLESLVVRTNNLVGDIYHRQPDSAGKYCFGEQSGHLSLRFINLVNIPGLHVGRPYGHEGYFDQDDIAIQSRDFNKSKHIQVAYHHATHLRRSSADIAVMQRLHKNKLELGIMIPSDEIPEIFSRPHPSIVQSALEARPFIVLVQSIFWTFMKTIKRNILK